MKRKIGLNHFLVYLMALGAVFITVSMVKYPEIAFSSAIRGLQLWWDIVFPALLPFFILSEILMALGVVHFMGVFLEPLMRPLFNVPGVGSFVMAMGLASGYPIGAILTAKLRRQHLCNRSEGERLMSCANTADPLFMVGAVAVGMFGDQKVGITIAIAHYLSSLTVGLLMRFYRPRDSITQQTEDTGGNVFVRAFRALYKARQEDGRPIGQLMGDAIRQSLNNLMTVGGFIILFSVFIQILRAAGVVQYIALALAALFRPLGITDAMFEAVTGGLFEITLGAQMAAQAAAPLSQRLIVTGGIIAWSGLSVHAQVASMINGTDIRMGPYIVARFFHALLAGGITALLLGPGGDYVSAMAGAVPLPAAVPAWSSWLSIWQYMGVKFLMICSLLLLAAIGLALARTLSRWRIRLIR
ncbi:MAG: sporulation integral membrane protein YlbJ [bacterium]|jgi:sporulation integral membrane protein YlbJ